MSIKLKLGTNDITKYCHVKCVTLLKLLFFDFNILGGKTRQCQVNSQFLFNHLSWNKQRSA